MTGNNPTPTVSRAVSGKSHQETSGCFEAAKLGIRTVNQFALPIWSHNAKVRDVNHDGVLWLDGIWY